MTDQHRFVSADHFDRDLYTSSQTGERVLNAAIVQVPSPASRNGRSRWLSISIRETPIPGDVADETHSAWTLKLVGVSGATCTLSWCTLPKWNESGVAYERHYDQQQSGGPLTFDDFGFNAAKRAERSRRPS